jgi:homoserine kinase type II
MTGFEATGLIDTPEPVAAALAMARRYGVEQLAAISQFESYGNENWLLETPDGARTVLRRYVHSPPERVRFQVDLLRRLALTGFPVAVPLTGESEQTIEMDAAGVAWVAFEHVDGREYNFSVDDAVQAARRLAEFHLLCASVADSAPRLRHRPPLRDCWANAGSDVAALQALFAGAGLDKELAYLEDWWDEVLREWPVDRLDALPRGLIHGDLHGRNTAYVDGKLVGIFDFDDVEPGPLVFDLAGSAYKFARGSRFQPAVRPEVMHAFIDAYAAVRTLSAEERAALPVLMAMTYPPNPRYYLYYRDHHGTNIENRLRREVGLMRLLRDEVQRVF